MAKRKPTLAEAPKVRKLRRKPDPLTQTPSDLEEHWADVAPGKSVPTMARKDLAKFVMDFCDGKVFTSAHIRDSQAEHLLHIVFLPLALGGLQGMYECEVKRIGLIWEYMSEAGYRAINGYPTFLSCRIMSKEDWDTARKAIQREMQRREKAAETVLDE